MQQKSSSPYPIPYSLPFPFSLFPIPCKPPVLLHIRSGSLSINWCQRSLLIESTFQPSTLQIFNSLTLLFSHQKVEEWTQSLLVASINSSPFHWVITRLAKWFPVSLWATASIPRLHFNSHHQHRFALHYIRSHRLRDVRRCWHLRAYLNYVQQQQQTNERQNKTKKKGPTVRVPPPGMTAGINRLAVRYAGHPGP